MKNLSKFALIFTALTLVTACGSDENKSKSGSHQSNSGSNKAKAMMIEKIDDTALFMPEMMRSAAGEPAKYRHCIQSSKSLESEFEARKEEIAEEGEHSEFRSIKWVDQCPPATATCVRNSGDRTDFYYTDSASILEQVKSGCQIKEPDPDEKDPWVIDMQKTASKYGGKWSATVTAEELKKTPEELAKEEQQRGQAIAKAFMPKGFGTDKKITLDVLKQDASVFRIVSDELKKDKDFVMKAVQINGSVLQYVDASLKNDKDLQKAQKTFNSKNK